MPRVLVSAFDKEDGKKKGRKNDGRGRERIGEELRVNERERERERIEREGERMEDHEGSTRSGPCG